MIPRLFFLIFILCQSFSLCAEDVADLKMSIKSISLEKTSESKNLAAALNFSNRTDIPYSIVLGGVTITLTIYDGSKAEIGKMSQGIPINPNSSNSVSIAPKFDLSLDQIRFSKPASLPEKGFFRVKYAIDQDTKIDAKHTVYSDVIETGLYSFESAKGAAIPGDVTEVQNFIINEIKGY
ncbi:MAG: hypothetical protein WAX69_05495 [Victivallales bacterium]